MAFTRRGERLPFAGLSADADESLAHDFLGLGAAGSCAFADAFLDAAAPENEVDPRLFNEFLVRRIGLPFVKSDQAENTGEHIRFILKTAPESQ